MIILDSPRPIRNGELFIPEYLRGHLSLKSGTDVTLCLLGADESMKELGITEMVVTPVKYDSWPHIWRIKARLRERPGVVCRALSVLRELDVNVLCEESTCMESGRVHSLEVIADLKNVRLHPRAAIRNRDPIASLENRLIACCFKDLIMDGGEVQLRMEQLSGFEAAYEAHRNSSPARGEGSRARVKVRNGHITIPSNLLSSIRSATESGPRRAIRAILASETLDRLLRVFFPRADQILVPARISHSDKVGALATITEVLARQFTILTSFTRLHNQDGRNHMEILLSPVRSGSKFAAEKQRLIRALRAPSLAPFDIEIAFPKSSSQSTEEWTPVPVNTRTQNRRRDFRPVNEGLDESTGVILSTLKHDIRKRLDRPSSHRSRQEDLARERLISRLQREEDTLVHNPTIFVSYEFSRAKYFATMQSLQGDHAFNLADGKDAFQTPAFREELVRRIQSADAFLGIWSGGATVASPWLLWEFGVAQAFEVPFRLLISKSLDPSLWSKMSNEIHHFIFEDLEFREQARKALEALKLDLGRVDRGG